MAYTVPKGHVCNPPFVRTATPKRWRCGACRKEYWYDVVKRRWELVV